MHLRTHIVPDAPAALAGLALRQSMPEYSVFYCNNLESPCQRRDRSDMRLSDPLQHAHSSWLRLLSVSNLVIAIVQGGYGDISCDAR